MSSGSRRSAILVESTRSANRTVRWRRSPPRTPDFSAAASRESDPVGLAATPHSGQNFAAGGRSVPHRSHAASSGAPHSMQKRAPSGDAAPHAAHPPETGEPRVIAQLDSPKSIRVKSLRKMPLGSH